MRSVPSVPSVPTRMSMQLLILALLAIVHWQPQTSGTTASLRGISAVNAKVVWVSGAKGTVLRTTDSGTTWQQIPVPDAAELDFRGIRAFSANEAILMSAGPGPLSRVYITADGGAHWKLTLTNKDEKGFYDGISFWDRKRGLILGDAVDGHMTLLRTVDGGASWTPATTPAALPGEGAFAASNTSLVVRPNGLAWFGTGGGAEARVFRSTDWGITWQTSVTPIRHDSPDSGIFSLVFRDDRHGVASGGKHSSPQESDANIAFTSDGGVTWTAQPGPAGFRSAVLTKGSTLFTTGTSGTDISTDNGVTWTPLAAAGFNALSTAGNAVWACGSNGRIAVLRWN